jgi:hypothetical protein
MPGWIDSNTKGSLGTSQQTEDRREKIQALSLAKECYSMKLDLLTNVTVVDDAIRFVASESEKSKDKDKEGEQVKSSSSSSPLDSSGSEYDKKESNEPDYDDDENS